MYTGSTSHPHTHQRSSPRWQPHQAMHCYQTFKINRISNPITLRSLSEGPQDVTLVAWSSINILNPPPRKPLGSQRVYNGIKLVLSVCLLPSAPCNHLSNITVILLLDKLELHLTKNNNLQNKWLYSLVFNLNKS